MASIVIAGDTSGSVTISAPAIAGTPTLTLPTTSGTLVVTGGAQTVQFAAGSAASPSITFTGDTNTGIFSPAADTIGFSEGGVESMRIDSSGNVGVGTTTPNAKVQIFKTAVGASGSTVTPANTALALQYDSSTVYGYHYMNADGVYFIDARTNGVAGGNICLWGQNSVQFRVAGLDSDTARMIINSSGNVGIGTSSPSYPLQVSKGTTGAVAFMVNPAGLTNFAVIPSNSGTTGTQIGTTGGDTLGFITNNTERMRITSGGGLAVMKTDPQTLGVAGFSADVVSGAFNAVTIVKNNATFGTALWINRLAAVGTGTLIEFAYASSQVGTITSNTTNTSYNTVSDYRLKENVQPMTDALNKVAQLKPCTYTWKSSGELGQGFIAHELQAVVPDAVTGEKDAVDKDGKPTYQGVDTSYLVATLTAAIQELNAKVEAQAAEIAALKGAN